MFAAALASGTPAFAADNVDDIAQAREALAKSGRFPWYDADKDALRPIRLPAPVAAPSAPTSSWNGPDIAFGELFQMLVWLMVAAALGLIVYWLVKAYLQRESRGARVSSSAAPDADSIRMDALPVAPTESVGDLLAKARRYYEQGQLREAMIYLFSHQLVELNKQQLIRLTRGKTNRQYLREVRTRPGLVPLLEQSIEVFELAFFGNQTPSREQFEAVWRRLGEFDQQVAIAGGS